MTRKKIVPLIIAGVMMASISDFVEAYEYQDLSSEFVGSEQNTGLQIVARHEVAPHVFKVVREDGVEAIEAYGKAGLNYEIDRFKNRLIELQANKSQSINTGMERYLQGVIDQMQEHLRQLESQAEQRRSAKSFQVDDFKSCYFNHHLRWGLGGSYYPPLGIYQSAVASGSTEYEQPLAGPYPPSPHSDISVAAVAHRSDGASFTSSDYGEGFTDASAQASAGCHGICSGWESFITITTYFGVQQCGYYSINPSS